MCKVQNANFQNRERKREAKGTCCDARFGHGAWAPPQIRVQTLPWYSQEGPWAPGHFSWLLPRKPHSFRARRPEPWGEGRCAWAGCGLGWAHSCGVLGPGRALSNEGGSHPPHWGQNTAPRREGTAVPVHSGDGSAPICVRPGPLPIVSNGGASAGTGTDPGGAALLEEISHSLATSEPQRKQKQVPV